MRNRHYIASVSVVSLLLLGAPMLPLPADGAEDSMSTKPESAARAESALATISAGDRVIARALFSAQVPTVRSEDQMRLEQIAAMRRDGRSWLDVFSEMKDRDLVQERNLGRLIAKQSNRRTADGVLVLSAPPQKKGSAVYVEAGLDGNDAVAGNSAAPQQPKAAPMK